MKNKFKITKVAGLLLFTVAFFISAYGTGIINQKMSNEEILHGIDTIMESYIGEKIPGAAVAVVKEGEIIVSKGYGFSDIENQIIVEPDETIFEYGSINKLFVWVSAMQLAEKGELDLSKDISVYLPENVNKKLNYDKPITMIDLMNHAGGFEDSMFDFARKEMEELPPLVDTLIKYEPKQIYQPGKVVAYSNYGSTLAAYVIKEISGEFFYDFERKNIFEFADMIKVAGHPLYKYNPNLIKMKAKGYTIKSPGLFDEKGWIYVPGYPAGGADGTVNALAKFALALTPEYPIDSPLFTTAESFDEMFNYGFWEYDGKIKSYGHSGNTAGFSSFFAVSPKERLGLIVLTNVADETEMIYSLQEYIFGKIPLKKGLQRLENTSSKDVVGKYLPARSSYNNFLEIFSYLSAYEVKDIGSGQIKLIIPGHEAEYIEVSPYKYNIYNASSLLMKYMYPELYFEKEGDSIRRVTSGQSVDLIPINKFRSILWFRISVISFGVVALYFMINPLLLLVRKIKSQEKFNKILLSLNFFGFSLVINNFLLIYNAFQNLYLSTEKLLIFIYINRVIALLFLILCVFIFVRREYLSLEKGIKINIFISSFILLSFMYLLYDWKFFNII